MMSVESRAREDDRLHGWKKIGGFLDVSVRTAQRWERTLQLPVNRIQTASSEIVFASRLQLQEWLEAHQGCTAPLERNGPEDGAQAGIEATLGCDVIEEDALDHSEEGVSTIAASLLSAEPAEPATNVALATQAEEQRARPAARPFRITPRIIAAVSCAAIALVGVLGFAVPRLLVTHACPSGGSPAIVPASGEAQASPIRQRDIVFLRVTFANSRTATVAVVVGTVATCADGNRSVAMSAEPTDDAGADLHLYQTPAGGQAGGLTDLAVIHLEPGRKTTVPAPEYLSTIEWLRTVHPSGTVKRAAHQTS